MTTKVFYTYDEYLQSVELKDITVDKVVEPHPIIWRAKDWSFLGKERILPQD